jgi:hypothetical protein
VSIGLVGSWFCSCVINIFKKSEKFPERDPSAAVGVDDPADVFTAVVAAREFWVALTLAAEANVVSMNDASEKVKL